MNPLTHTPSGFVRSLQMSRHNICAFVEGQDCDSFFYDGICNQALRTEGFSFKIRRAKELPYQTGGKSSLIQFYKYLRSKQELSTKLKGKNTVILFFLDKDIDDVLRRKCRSPHVIYTKYYDLQNHLFLNADFLKALAAATSIEESEIRCAKLFKNNWCRLAARRWRGWMVLCLLNQKFCTGRANYRLTSQINRPINGRTDRYLYRREVEEFGKNLGWSRTIIKSEVSKMEKLVDKHFANGSQDHIFKGKWYCPLIEKDIRDAFRTRQANFSGIANRITSSLAATLDFSEPWATHFTSAIGAVIREIP